jgi:hypothetical protein
VKGEVAGWRSVDRIFFFTFGFAFGGILAACVIAWLLSTGELVYVPQ